MDSPITKVKEREEALLKVARALHTIPQSCCKDVPVERLTAYVLDHGWRKSNKLIYVAYTVWTKPPVKGAKVCPTIRLPRTDEPHFNGSYISEMLSYLSIDEDRYPIDILLELLGV